MLASLKPGADFSRGCAARRIGHLLFTILPYRYEMFELPEAAHQCPKL
jgi:hypothetical protein